MTDGIIPIFESDSYLANLFTPVSSARSVMVLTNVKKTSLEEDSKVASASKRQKKTTMYLVTRT